MPHTDDKPRFQVRRSRVSDASAFTRLQRETLHWGNLAALGDGFLDLMHRQIIRSRHATSFVAERDGRILGFIIWTVDSRRFYRGFLWRRGLQSGLRLLPLVLFRGRWRTVWRCLTYYPAVPAADPKAEAVTWAVLPDAQGQGVGRALMRAVIEDCRRRGVPALKAGHVPLHQPATNAAYRAMGFQLVRQERFYRHVPVNVYVLRLERRPGARRSRRAGR